jgi:hypothetical protein
VEFQELNELEKIGHGLNAVFNTSREKILFSISLSEHCHEPGIMVRRSAKYY